MVRGTVPMAVVAALVLGACTDPFSPADPQAPTTLTRARGSSEAASVPVDFGHALDSSRTDRISALLSDSASFEGNDQFLSRSALFTCASRLAGFSAPCSTWTGAVSPISIGTDTVVEVLDYSLGRAGRRLAYARATWTVVRSGTEWKLLRWKESGQDSGWAQLCRSPR